MDDVLELDLGVDWSSKRQTC
ncbi:unnamed protein product [Cuscuta epithymum]|uniref:Uncharacterized protein n=1 Tax=Cuscuta epithymum TaxID=186058 RepID=A0AAV0BZK4_9ASTE|nr:unnamed protein product [Cuscuta epithymum]